MAARKKPCDQCGAPRDARAKSGLCRDCHAEANKAVDPRAAKALELARDGAEELVIASELGIQVAELVGEIREAIELGHSYFISDARKRAKDRASKSTTAANDRLLLEEAGRLEMAKRSGRSAPGSAPTLNVILADDADAEITAQVASMQKENARLRRQVEALEARGVVPDGALDLDWPPDIDDAYAQADPTEQEALHAEWERQMSEWADAQVTRIREAGRACPPAPERDDIEDPSEHARILRMHRHLVEAWDRSEIPEVRDPFPSPAAMPTPTGRDWKQKQGEIRMGYERAVDAWGERELSRSGGKHPKRPLRDAPRIEWLRYHALRDAWKKRNGVEDDPAPVYVGAHRIG